MVIPDRYDVRTRLQHHSGEVWMVIHNEPTDDYLSEGMIPLADDYVLRLVDDPPGRGLGIGALRRVHADYLHGDGWTVIDSPPLHETRKRG